jgi:hypothetical protein
MLIPALGVSIRSQKVPYISGYLGRIGVTVQIS